MAKPNPWLYLVSAAAIGALLVMTQYAAYHQGYQARVAEDHARDKEVAQDMTDMGFCRWLDKVSFDEECAAYKRRDN